MYLFVASRFQTLFEVLQQQDPSLQDTLVTQKEMISNILSVTASVYEYDYRNYPHGIMQRFSKS